MEKPLRLNVTRWFLCFDESCQVAPGAFAKLAFSKLVCERFQIGDTIELKSFQRLSVRRVEMKRYA